MKNLLALLILTLFFTGNSQNQKALERSSKLFTEIKNKPLYVVLDVEDPKYISKLVKKEKTQELNNYKKLISDYNTYIKSAVDSFLNIFPDVFYITTNELKLYKKEDLKNINLLVRMIPPSTGVAGVSRYEEVLRFTMINTLSTDGSLNVIDMDTNNVSERSVIELRSYNDNDMVPYTSQGTAKLFCTKIEVIYSIRQMRRMIEDAINKVDATIATNNIIAALKTKTLLLNKNYLVPGLTEEDIKTAYANKFKIISNTEFEAEVSKKNPDVLLMIPMAFPVPNMNMRAIHTILDTNTDTVYWPNASKCKGPIEKKHFEYFGRL